MVAAAAAAAGRGGGASSSSSGGSSLVPGGGTNNDNVAIRASISSAMHAAQRCQQPVAAAAAGSRNNHDSPGEWERFLDQYGSRGLNNLYGRGSLGGGGGGNGAGPLPFDWLSRTMAYNQARDADVGVGCAGGSGLAASMNDALQQAEARFFMEADQRSAFASGSGNNNASSMIILTTMTIMMMKMARVAMPRQHQEMNGSSKTGIITMLLGMAIIGIITTIRERMAMMTTTLLKEMAM